MGSTNWEKTGRAGLAEKPRLDGFAAVSGILQLSEP